MASASHAAIIQSENVFPTGAFAHAAWMCTKDRLYDLWHHAQHFESGKPSHFRDAKQLLRPTDSLHFRVFRVLMSILRCVD